MSFLGVQKSAHECAPDRNCLKQGLWKCGPGSLFFEVFDFLFHVIHDGVDAFVVPFFGVFFLIGLNEAGAVDEGVVDVPLVLDGMEDDFEFGFDVFLLGEAGDGGRGSRWDDAIPVDFVVVFEGFV